MDSLMWGGSRIRMVAIGAGEIAALSALLGVLQFGWIGAVLGIPLGMAIGVLMGLVTWTRAPELAPLPPDDRIAVLRWTRHQDERPRDELIPVAAAVAVR